jgi:5'-3' exoribonuclease 1
MGIPSYFANVVKYHKQIIKKLGLLPVVHNLYMDTNGLVYDAVRIVGSNAGISNDDYETAIIDMVCKRIQEYIQLINPKYSVFIAFDGVAPVAKLNQQRERRYKSWFTTIVEQAINLKNDAKDILKNDDEKFRRDQTSKDINKTLQKAWNTSSITPGTRFMEKLNNRMRDFINMQVRATSASHSESTNLKYIYSGSDIAGEGEHKLFEYIRANPEHHKETTTMIYGLDADLIMLCLNHLHVSENIYLYRDTPEFIQSLDSNLSKTENYFLDIPSFACSLEKLMRETKASGIAPEMSFVAPTAEPKLAVSSSIITPQVIAAIDDYILMTFMLGNDFMPHFPSLNLRTTGMNVLLQTYAHVFRNSTSYLVKRTADATNAQQKTIDWKQMRLFVECLSASEHDRFIDQHKTRDRQSKRFGGGGGSGNNQHRSSSSSSHSSTHGQNPKQSNIDLTELTGAACERITDIVSSGNHTNSLNEFMTIPLQERSIEKYIDPFRENWEFRYYDSLFDIDIHERSSGSAHGQVDRLQQICVNYMEGLEWTMKYYSSECMDWRWCYKYAYAPLLTDLVRFIPHADVKMITEKPKDPVRDVVQLCYVLPMASHNLLSTDIAAKIKKELSHYYCDKLEFKWAYCKYFWEAHTELPHIRISELERVVSTTTK